MRDVLIPILILIVLVSVVLFDDIWSKSRHEKRIIDIISPVRLYCVR